MYLYQAWFWPRQHSDTNNMFKFWYSQVSVFHNSVRGMTKAKTTSISHCCTLGWVVLAGIKMGSLPKPECIWPRGLPFTQPQIANFTIGCYSPEESATATLKLGSRSVSKIDKVAIRYNFSIHLSVLYSIMKVGFSLTTFIHKGMRIWTKTAQQPTLTLILTFI